MVIRVISVSFPEPLALLGRVRRDRKISVSGRHRDAGEVPVQSCEDGAPIL
jgi:hypothetical protein